MNGIRPDDLAELYDRYAGSLVLYARSWCAHPEDVVQEAFLALSRQRSLPEEPGPWLYRVVRNGAIAAGRTERRRQGREAKVSRAEAWFESGEDRVAAEEAVRLLEELDSETREVIVARVWGGLTFEATARLVGCSLTSAHRKYNAGLARLQERLEPSCPDPSTNSTAG